MEKNNASFSTILKQEMLNTKPMKRQEIFSELYGLLLSKSSFNNGDIIFKTEINYIARRVYEDLKMLDNVFFQFSYSSSKKLGSHNVFTFKIMNKTKHVREIFEGEHIDKWVLRGFFLSSGYIRDPNKGYSLDFFIDSEKSALVLYQILKKMDTKVFMTKKKNKEIVYIRNNEDILDIIIMLDGINSFFKYQEITINKEIVLNITRSMNYELANETKKLVTSQEQIRMIKKIDEHIGLNKLTESLREVSLLRLKKEEASLQELADILNITKSGIRNRFRRLKEIYEEIGE